MAKDETMTSLYDFRGRSDYDKKGQDVYETAKKRGIKCEGRKIENPKYTGEVVLYPKWFLQEYFYGEDPKDNITQDIENDDLPF
jgi:hypothetical protein